MSLFFCKSKGGVLPTQVLRRAFDRKIMTALYCLNFLSKNKCTNKKLKYMGLIQSLHQESEQLAKTSIKIFASFDFLNHSFSLTEQ
jgi:hypothetical protein